MLAVGAPLVNNGTGRVQVFEKNGTNWVQRGSVIPGFENANFGHSVSLSDDGTVLAVGAPKYQKITTEKDIVSIGTLSAERQSKEAQGYTCMDTLSWDYYPQYYQSTNHRRWC